jgi:galactokinase
MKIRSSAPGRICLFGEHQDYLGFPVIAAAIDLRITIEGEVSEGDSLHLELPDLKKTLAFCSTHIEYTNSKDYLKSVVNVLKKKELYKPKTIHAKVKGNVPMAAGTSSSAALSVAWTGFLLEASGNASYIDNPRAVAELAYLAEVEEFNESGGRMDQYTAAIGGIVYLDFYEGMKSEPLPVVLKEFVLGDSLQPKDTQKTLKRVRTAQEEAFKELGKHMSFKDNFHVTYEEVEPIFTNTSKKCAKKQAFEMMSLTGEKDLPCERVGVPPHFNKIPSDILPYLRAALMNHQITDQAKGELLKESPDIRRISRLMNEHHGFLRDDLGVSTPKIERMIERAMAAGALASKINGSGEGGCMFAFCPGKQEEVAEAIKEAGGKPYIINIGNGLKMGRVPL